MIITSVPLVRHGVSHYTQLQFWEIASYINGDKHHSLLFSATDPTGRVARAMEQADHRSLSVSGRLSVIASEDARSSNTQQQ